MKIAMVCEQSSHVTELATALRRQGHDVTTHFLEETESRAHLADFAATLRNEWDETPPDVVHTHFWTSGLAGALAARRIGVPVVHTFRGLGSAFPSTPEISAERLQVERLLSRDAAHVVASCSNEAFELARMGAHQSRISVIPRGVDTSVFTTDGPIAKKTRSYRIVTSGDLRPASGFRELIRVLCTEDQAELVIAVNTAGGNVDADRELAHLRALAQESGVSDRIVLTDRGTASEWAALLRSADLVASVPWHAPSDATALEAMACGTPVITTPVGDLVDIVIDGLTGRHVPPRSPGALARAVRALLTDSTTCLEFGMAARDRVCARHTWDRVALDTLRVYERAGATEPRPAQAKDTPVEPS